MPIHHSLFDRLHHFRVNHPDYEAIVTPSLTWSYAQLFERVQQQAMLLQQSGVCSDSVIGIKCTDDLKHLIFCLAVIQVGATSFTVPTHETETMQDKLVGRCRATHIVSNDLVHTYTDRHKKDKLTRVENIAKETISSHATLLFSTSGTTGEPKIVIHQDNDLVAQAYRHVNSEQERFVCLASMEHNFVKRHRLYCVAMGATNVFLDAVQESLVSQCLSLKVNVMHVSAFQAQELLAQPDIRKLAHLRLKLGGSHVPVSMRQRLRQGITENLQAGYGTTETGAIGFTDPEDDNAGESVGRPLPGIEIQTVSPQGKALKKGQQGEIAIRCDGMFRSYLDNPELTKKRLKDGWFFTGDIGYLDDRQRIFVCGRCDDMFVFNSINIYPQEIESQICQYPQVRDAAVLPRPSSVHGNIPVALVVFEENQAADLNTLRQFVKQHAGIRSPRQYVVVENIPRNTSGKIVRGEAIKLLAKNSDIRQTIIAAMDQEVLKKLKPAELQGFFDGKNDIDLSQFQLDSLARMNLLIALETDFDTIIHPQEFSQIKSLGDLVNRVLSCSSGPPLNKPTEITYQANRDDINESENLPYLLKFFHRIMRYCRTVAQLNKALGTLDYRLTPSQVESLKILHEDGQLLLSGTAEKFHIAINEWLAGIIKMMHGSNKENPESFIASRVASTVTLYTGKGEPDNKTLLVCFSESGGRGLMMPNAVLLQHVDAKRYDLLIVAEPKNLGYLKGVPMLGNSITEVCESIARLDCIAHYHSIRTFGCSAGGYAAVIAGYILGAELAVCAGGRFHSERYPLRILDRILTTWRSIRRGHCSRALLSYSVDKSRDRRYSRLIGWLTGGNLVGVESASGYIDHMLLRRLVERGELAPFLANSIFAEMDNKLIRAEKASVILSVPSSAIRPNNEAFKSDMLPHK